MCPMHTEAKQDIGIWSRERFIEGPCKEMGVSCPQNPEFFKGFQQDIFKGKVREGLGEFLQTYQCWNSLFF